MIQDFGRVVIIIGVILIIVGAIFLVAGKVPFLGKLPGDILVKRENFAFYAPIASAILISILLSIVLTIIFTLKR